MAVLACHLFLRPGVLTSQLRSSSTDATQSAAAPQSENPPAPQSTDPTAPPASLPPQNKTTEQNKTEAEQQEEDSKATEQFVQQMMEAAGEDNANPRPALNVSLGRDEVLLQADEQEKDQDIYHARGHVVVRFRTYVLHCDAATYDSTTGIITATGHVVFDGGVHNEHVIATHGTYDVSRDSGTFYDAAGSTGMRIKNKQMFLTSSNPFFFGGRTVEKLGPDRYRVNHGYLTSCQLPKPKWEFDAANSLIEMGEDARMHHATLRIHGIPVFYFPYAQHPVDNLGRKSGFLIPVIGISNTRGTVLGDGFYWAINRSSDATIGAEYFSKRGWAQHATYRAIGYDFRFQAEYFGVIDQKGYPGTGQNQGGEEAKFNSVAKLPMGFRGVLAVDYLSSYIFRLAFGQSFVDAVNSEVRSAGFLSKSWSGNYGAFLVSRYQNYQSSMPEDVIDIAHTPSLQLAGVEKPIGNSSFMYAYDAAAEGLSRHEPGFETAPVVGRVDAHPWLSLPIFLQGWTFRPELGADETLYTQQLETGTGTGIPNAVSDALNRNVLHTSMEIRAPSVSRIFDKKPLGYVYKHVVEPYATYRYQTGISNFSNIIRFDYRDILADTNEVRYGIVNRLYAKKSSSEAECYRAPKYRESISGVGLPELTEEERKKGFCDDAQGAAREIVTWEVSQKYYMNTNFGGALVTGSRNVFDTSADLTGIAFLYQPRRFSPIVSRVKMQDNASDVQWAFDYDTVTGQVNASTILIGQRFGPNWYVNAGQLYMNVPASIVPGGTTVPANVYNQFRLQLNYGNMSRTGFNVAGNVGYDYELKQVQYSNIQLTYNWDCCGVTFEYKRWALGSVRNENYYRFALSLANFGTFGTIRRQDRLY